MKTKITANIEVILENPRSDNEAIEDLLTFFSIENIGSQINSTKISNWKIENICKEKYNEN